MNDDNKSEWKKCLETTTLVFLQPSAIQNFFAAASNTCGDLSVRRGRDMCLPREISQHKYAFFNTVFVATYYVEEVSIIISVFSHVLHAIKGWLCCHFDCHGGPGAFPAFADTTFPLHDELLQCKHNANTSTFLDATTIAC